MSQSLKQRLVGALILLALAILLIPALFDLKQVDPPFEVVIPAAPAMPVTPEFAGQTGPGVEPLANMALLPEGQADVTSAKEQADALNEASLSAPATQEQLDQANAAVAWTLQLGTFGNRANAQRLMSELQAEGFHAYQRDFQQKDGSSLSRIYVGPQVSRSELQKIAQKLQSKRQLKGLILRYHP